MNKFEMTESQKKAFEGLSNFMKIPIKEKDPSTRFAVLTGKAGTGKTWLTQTLLEPLYKNDIGIDLEEDIGGLFTPNVVGIAFTHKAKGVLGKKIPCVSTFAKFYGMREDYEKNGDPIFTINRRAFSNSLSQKAIPIIAHDECSMHSKSMVQIANKYTHPRTKIIYIGDPGQLPPVEKDHDNSDKDSLTFISSPRIYHLDERVRQTEGNPIIDLSDEIYKEIFGNQDVSKVLNLLNQSKMSNGFGYKTIDKSDVLNKYLEVADDYYQSKLITYRNKTLKTWNANIRSLIYEGNNDRFIEGELIYMNKGFRDENNSFTLHNSSEYKVLGYEDSYVRVDGHNEIKFIKCYKVFVEKDEDQDSDLIRYVSILNPIDYNKYLIVKNDKLNNALKNNESPKDRGKYWKFYYDFLNSFGSISYGYSYTGHKAQGSGYKNIFLDVSDILSSPTTNKRKLQALYTGITRTSENLYLIQ